MMLYLSRAFVEFGPFAAAELISFYQRGILKETDYVRAEGSDDWLHVEDWASSLVPVAAPIVKKPVAKKKTKPAAEPVKATKAPAKKPKKAA
jgi:hypothetical protein